MIETYTYSSCTSCRNTDQFLKESGVAFTSRDFFKQRFIGEELKSVLDGVGLTVPDVLSKRSKVYRARNDEIDAVNDDALLELMVEEPTLLRRPIVVDGATAIVGHNPRRLQTLVDEERVR